MKSITDIVILVSITACCLRGNCQEPKYNLLKQVRKIDDSLSYWKRPLFIADDGRESDSLKRQNSEAKLDTIFSFIKKFRKDLYAAEYRNLAKRDFYRVEKHIQNCLNLIEFYHRDLQDHKYAAEARVLVLLRTEYLNSKAILERRFARKHVRKNKQT